MKRWMMERLHISTLVAILFGSIIAGILLCIIMPDAIFAHNTWFLVALILIFIACIRCYRVSLLLVIFAGILIGLWRGSIAEQSANGYARYHGKDVEISGLVTDDTSFGPKGDQRLRIKDVTINSNPMGGEVWVSLDTDSALKRSDSVVVRGVLNEGFGNFSAVIFSAKLVSVERSSTQDMGLQARDTFAGGVAKGLSGPELSLGLGYLLGLKSALPELLEKQIMVVGLTHVVVASGYNLTILVSFARRIFARFSKYLAALCGGSMIIGFMMITGLSPSMSRAGLVAGLSLLAWYYGRKIHPVSLLVIAAACTLLVKPTYIWGDLGWYLSFAAFFGILVLAPLLHDYFWGKDKKPSLMRELIVATSSAQIVTLPIIIAAFGNYSVYALPANLLVLPLVPFSMFATFIAGLGGLLLPWVADIIAFPAYVLLKYCTFVIDKISGLPNAQGELTISVTILAVSYVVLLLGILFLQRKTKHNFLDDKSIVD